MTTTIETWTALFDEIVVVYAYVSARVHDDAQRCVLRAALSDIT